MATTAAAWLKISATPSTSAYAASQQAACKYASVVAALAFLKGEAGFHTQLADWDADPYLLNCADGLLDLRTQTLRHHESAALCTKLTIWPLKSPKAAAPGTSSRALPAGPCCATPGAA